MLTQVNGQRIVLSDAPLRTLRTLPCTSTHAQWASRRFKRARATTVRNVYPCKYGAEIQNQENVLHASGGCFVI